MSFKLDAKFNPSRQSRSMIAVAFSIVAIATFNGIHANAVLADGDVSGIVYDRVERTGRYFGAGWGDGYHACESSGYRLGADLPPVSARVDARRAGFRRGVKKKAETFYDRFDAGRSSGGPTIHPTNYRVRSNVSRRASCDDASCDDAGCGEVVAPITNQPNQCSIVIPPVPSPVSQPLMMTEPIESLPVMESEELDSRRIDDEQQLDRKKDSEIDAEGDLEEAESSVQSPSDQDVSQTRQPESKPTRLPRPSRLPLPELAAPSTAKQAGPTRLPRPGSKDRVAEKSQWQSPAVKTNPFFR